MSAAVTFALANRLTQFVWALPGVLVPLLGAHLPSQEELRELEELQKQLESEDPSGVTGAADDASATGSASPATGK